MCKYLIAPFLLLTIQTFVKAQNTDKDSLNSGYLLIEADSLIISEIPKCEEPIDLPIPQKKLCQGYRIQVYFDRNRDKALLKQKEFDLLFPDLLSQLVYQAPHYKIQFGHFIHKNSAEKNRDKILSKFPESILIISPSYLCHKALDYKNPKKTEN